MDLADIRAFLAVAEELHFGRAAARLHMAQPPLSRTIKRLERKLGATLFDRNTRSVQLTASGAALVGPSREVLEAIRRAEIAVRSAANGEVGEVRIAFAGLSTHLLVAEVARAVRAGHPGVHLELSSQNFAQPAMKKVVIGETDLALGRWDVVPAEVATEVVMADSLVVALPDTHRLAELPSISIAALAEDGFVSLPLHEGAIMPDRLRRVTQAKGFVANIIQVAPDTQTALALVSAEVGCHLTLASVARNVHEPHVSFVPLTDDAPDVDLRAAWRRDDTNPALRAVLDAMFALRE
ncbi:putative LysR family transcriptional regulator [Gordonia effusa NBRC 100432]|uniref:Putative LysR family transcriptional regulator n=1 Tax=Gordonia effusa NBRC 100432 TaxID=1077974 RepID=H0QZI5_9ACTN|nr:LysR substrate-binding domain-containing protein [Gordonia effusa]GAB18236.1 putative LysR family transcriptional regulator [Gordonia effusa NBRC 100432]